jgi:hypothetical protein
LNEKHRKLIKMPAQISFELKEAIMALQFLKLFMQKTVNQLLVVGKNVTFSTVHSKKEKDSGHTKSSKGLATHQRPSVITKRFLERLDVEISKRNPLSSRQFSRK